MPADRRATFPTVKPVKTERTHEENQERAYIAASRRSDRSLEARIESARRASEIHKKRTGRALRVTEQDVVNEEMYEEEDEDLPTQYQRLNAHLQTSSWLFNRKLHDYIATQQGVRTMFMNQQFPGQVFQPYPTPFQPNASMSTMSPTMMPPQAFSPTSPTFAQQPQTMSPHALQQPPAHNYRAAPYSLAQRPNVHQRAQSISTPAALSNAVPSGQQSSPKIDTPTSDASRRLSLPARQNSEGLSAQSSLPSTSTQRTTPLDGHGPTSGQTTPQLTGTFDSAQGFPFHGLPFTTASFADTNPLSLSLPPESQQLIGSTLDPNDPRTAIFMAGSEHVAQPFTGSYTYNPNLCSKGKQSAKEQDAITASGMAAAGAVQTSPSIDVDKSSTTVNGSSDSPPSSMMTSMFTPNTLMDPNAFDQTSFFDQYQFNDGQHNSNDIGLNDSFEESCNWVNWE